MRALLDTSVLIAAERPGEIEGAISAASLAELHFGALVRTVDVTSDGGFSYTADPEALDAGEPTLLEALDRSGHALETSPGPPSPY